MEQNLNGQIIFEDNLKILHELEDGSIDLIYIDPPFNTGKKQSRTRIKVKNSVNGDRIGFKGKAYESVNLGTKEYDDDFGDGFINEYLRPRLIEAYRILANYGSLYFHIDYREVHYCKILLDEIFGRESFMNEIIWAYDYGAKAKTKWPTKHDNILFYVKNPHYYIFNVNEINREPYMAPGLVSPEKAKNGKLPTDTWWHTIVGTNSKERTGYPTQKPRAIIDRIIQASSLPGQTVLDFFAGSGTIGESCLHLNRKFILVDNNPSAMQVMAKRFQAFSSIKWINFDPKPFQETKDGNSPFEMETPNAEFELLANFANSIRNRYEQPQSWESSPLDWIISYPAAKKGKLGKELIAAFCLAKGLRVERSNDKYAGLCVSGYKVATKFSTLWSEGSYKFQQIRSEGYDLLICLGISPSAAHCWVFNRDLVISKAIPQHTEGNQKIDYWITIDPNNVPEWMNTCGGSLENAYEILSNLKSDLTSPVEPVSIKD